MENLEVGDNESLLENERFSILRKIALTSETF